MREWFDSISTLVALCRLCVPIAQLDVRGLLRPRLSVRARFGTALSEMV